jgi:hypothetical protein
VFGARRTAASGGEKRPLRYRGIEEMKEVKRITIQAGRRAFPF